MESKRGRSQRKSTLRKLLESGEKLAEYKKKFDKYSKELSQLCKGKKALNKKSTKSKDYGTDERKITTEDERDDISAKKRKISDSTPRREERKRIANLTTRTSARNKSPSRKRSSKKQMSSNQSNSLEERHNMKDNEPKAKSYMFSVDGHRAEKLRSTETHEKKKRSEPIPFAEGKPPESSKFVDTLNSREIQISPKRRILHAKHRIKPLKSPPKGSKFVAVVTNCDITPTNATAGKTSVIPSKPSVSFSNKAIATTSVVPSVNSEKQIQQNLSKVGAIASNSDVLGSIIKEFPVPARPKSNKTAKPVAPTINSSKNRKQFSQSEVWKTVRKVSENNNLAQGRTVNSNKNHLFPDEIKTNTPKTDVISRTSPFGRTNDISRSRSMSTSPLNAPTVWQFQSGHVQMVPEQNFQQVFQKWGSHQQEREEEEMDIGFDDLPITVTGVSEKQGTFLVVDTNILMGDLKYFKSLVRNEQPGIGYVNVVVPWPVFNELDGIKMCRKPKHKQDSELGQFHRAQNEARDAIEALNKLLEAKHPRLICQTPKQCEESARLPGALQVEITDDKMLNCCIQWQLLQPDHAVLFVTNDKNLRNKALVSNISAFSAKSLPLFFETVKLNVSTGNEIVTSKTCRSCKSPTNIQQVPILMGKGLKAPAAQGRCSPVNTFQPVMVPTARAPHSQQGHYSPVNTHQAPTGPTSPQQVRYSPVNTHQAPTGPTSPQQMRYSPVNTYQSLAPQIVRRPVPQQRRCSPVNISQRPISPTMMTPVPQDGRCSPVNTYQRPVSPTLIAPVPQQGRCSPENIPVCWSPVLHSLPGTVTNSGTAKRRASRFSPLLDEKTENSLLPTKRSLPSTSCQSPVSPAQNSNLTNGIGEKRKCQLNSDSANKEPGLADEMYREISGSFGAALKLVLEEEMRKVYDDMWLEIVFKKPPWGLQDALLCFQKHWIAVFGYVFPRPLQQTVNTLVKLYKTEQYTVKHIKAIIPHALSLCREFKSKSHYGKTVITTAVLVLEELELVTRNINLNNISSLEEEKLKIAALNDKTKTSGSNDTSNIPQGQPKSVSNITAKIHQGQSKAGLSRSILSKTSTQASEVPEKVQNPVPDKITKGQLQANINRSNSKLILARTAEVQNTVPVGANNLSSPVLSGANSVYESTRNQAGFGQQNLDFTPLHFQVLGKGIVYYQEQFIQQLECGLMEEEERQRLLEALAILCANLWKFYTTYEGILINGVTSENIENLCRLTNHFAHEIKIQDWLEIDVFAIQTFFGDSKNRSACEDGLQELNNLLSNIQSFERYLTQEEKTAIEQFTQNYNV